MLNLAMPKSSTSSSQESELSESFRENTAGVPSMPENTRGDSLAAVSKGDDGISGFLMISGAFLAS